VSPARIVHAPFDVGGQARGLSLAERELGLVSDVVVFSPQRWGYENDIDLNAGLTVPVPMRMARRARFLFHALDAYDIFHFNFGHTLLQVRQLRRVVDELPLLRRRGKTILMTYQGCDARTFDHCHCRRPSCIPDTTYRRRSAERFLRYADRVFYLNPDLATLLPGARFLPYANVDPHSVTPVPPALERDEVVVAHAPTDRTLKGTEHVIEAVASLRAQGLPVRLELHENLTRRVVLERLRAADIVVDQLIMGWYGGFAVEAMALAKPVISHIREEANPFGERLPVVRGSPAVLAERIRELALDPQRRREIGLACRRFAEEKHDPRRVAYQVLDGLVELPALAHASPPSGSTRSAPTRGRMPT
jgi:glycosyltransferase involved in cell wall biosynthesis